MDPISAYLSKFQVLTPPTRTIKRACVEVIADEMRVTIDESAIEVQQGRTVRVNGHAALKQEVFMRHDTLRTKVNKKLADIGYSIERLQ